MHARENVTESGPPAQLERHRRHCAEGPDASVLGQCEFQTAEDVRAQVVQERRQGTQGRRDHHVDHGHQRRDPQHLVRVDVVLDSPRLRACLLYTSRCV